MGREGGQAGFLLEIEDIFRNGCYWLDYFVRARLSHEKPYILPRLDTGMALYLAGRRGRTGRWSTPGREYIGITQ